MEKKLYSFKLFLLISITLLFFSANSLLVRAALIENYIDAFGFTLFRLLFGTLTLLLLFYIKEKTFAFRIKDNWFSSFFLFLYAIAFSYAYINLEAGVGTLILFAVVQLLIMKIAFLKGERITILKVFGILISFFGLFYLLIPDKNFSLPFYEVFLMAISGLGWAFYTILGKNTKNALFHTTDNFLKASIFALLFYLFFIDNIEFNYKGVVLAFISGGITSAIGYLLWYYILPKIDILTSGIVQLIVPPLSIFLSVLLLNELFTFKLFLSTDLILIGISIAIFSSVKR